MRTLLLLLFFLGLGLTSYEQGTPLEVKKNFSLKFPNATEISWEAEDLYYIADFTEENKSKTVTYDEDGKWIETAVYYHSYTELPPQVITPVTTMYVDGEITNVVAYSYNINITVFQMNVYKDELNYFIKVRDDGTLLSSEIVDQNEDPEDDDW